MHSWSNSINLTTTSQRHYMSEKTTEDFEVRLDKAKAILEKLMNPEITLSDSVKAYENGMKELQAAQKMLENAQLQVETIRKGE